MTYRFEDKFNRADGAIGDNYTVACGGVLISDEAVIPIDATEIVSGVSPILGASVTAQKTQVFYTNEFLDGPDYVVRTTWAHDGIEPSSLPTGITTAPSFTALARMSKDPLLFDLGVDEDPLCYDQGYGARVTFPLDGSAPILKIVKYQPAKRLPGQTRPTSTEVDNMVVLASVTLEPDDLNLEEGFDASSYSDGDILPYKGIWQDMRLRIRRADNEVILEVYLNDRNLNTAKLTHTDKRDPLWGDIGLPGFEFLSGTLSTQPSGVSGFSLKGLATLRCGIFSAETFRDVRRPVRVTPGSMWTYRRVINRVLALVEKQGDASYTATTAGQTKIDLYRDFVLETESDIIRKEGYFEWLRRTQRVYLENDKRDYELPEDIGLLETIVPGNWNSTPLQEMTKWEFEQRLGGATRTNGRPTIYHLTELGPNNRPVIRVFPFPGEGAINTNDDDDPYLEVSYFARQIIPDELDIQIPFVPQEDMDVLIYGSAAHALLMDTDPQNAQFFSNVYASKLRDLRRKNNRKVSSRQTVARSMADLAAPDVRTRIPLLRATQLDNLLAF